MDRRRHVAQRQDEWQHVHSDHAGSCGDPPRGCGAGKRMARWAGAGTARLCEYCAECSSFGCHQKCRSLRIKMDTKIIDAKVIVTCPGRNFVTLKITTADGVYGVGDGTLNGRELAVSAYLQEHVVPCLIGRDADRIEDTWQYLYRGAYWRRGPVTMAAIAAVDTALWDIKAKRAN